MILCKVIRNIWATQKEVSLSGYRLVLVSPLNKEGVIGDDVLVAVDQLGAGSGDLVLVLQGYSAFQFLNQEAPIDAVIVALADFTETDFLEK